MNPAFDFAKTSERDFRRFSCDMDQFAWARASSLSEGDARGDRVIDVDNGSGLRFTIVPDRGLDLVEASFRGLPLVFRSPSGHVSGARHDDGFFGWLRAWNGGLMTSCGLRHVGAPERGSYSPIDPATGLHGRVSRQAASDVGIKRGWRDGRYSLSVSGTLREAMMFGENLRRERTISTALGDNSILVEDVVANLGPEPDFLEVLFHCNFGFPAIAPGARIETVEHELRPRDEEAAKGLSCWNEICEPVRGFKEQCFLHKIPAGPDGFAKVSVVNERAKLRFGVAYDVSTLPNLIQWRMMGEGIYVLGLEPSNATLAGREKDIASGAARKIEPGEKVSYRLKLFFESL